eukprot:768073-Hanusia_phi.AAC.3
MLEQLRPMRRLTGLVANFTSEGVRQDDREFADSSPSPSPLRLSLLCIVRLVWGGRKLSSASARCLVGATLVMVTCRAVSNESLSFHC